MIIFWILLSVLCLSRPWFKNNLSNSVYKIFYKTSCLSKFIINKVILRRNPINYLYYLIYYYIYCYLPELIKNLIKAYLNSADYTNFVQNELKINYEIFQYNFYQGASIVLLINVVTFFRLDLYDNYFNFLFMLPYLVLFSKILIKRIYIAFVYLLYVLDIVKKLLKINYNNNYNKKFNKNIINKKNVAYFSTSRFNNSKSPKEKNPSARNNLSTNPIKFKKGVYGYKNIFDIGNAEELSSGTKLADKINIFISDLPDNSTYTVLPTFKYNNSSGDIKTLSLSDAIKITNKTSPKLLARKIEQLIDFRSHDYNLDLDECDLFFMYRQWLDEKEFNVSINEVNKVLEEELQKEEKDKYTNLDNKSENEFKKKLGFTESFLRRRENL